MLQVWDDIVNMLKVPFVGDLDLFHLFLLVGFILLFMAAWALILSYAKEGVGEIIP
jgi:hypothetical protein